MVRLKNKGFSVVELIIAVTILVLVMGGTIYYFSSSRFSHDSTEMKISVLHQGRMLLEYLKRDLRSIHYHPDIEKSFFEENGDSFTFSKILKRSSTTNITDTINYSFSKGTGNVLRNCDKGRNITFGSENAIIKTFKVKKIRSKIKGKLCTGFSIKIQIEDKNKNSRNSLNLEEKIFPPILKYYSCKKWID